MTSTTLIDHRSQPDEQEDEIALPKQQFDEQKNITEEQKVMINEQKDMINDRLFQQDRQAVTMHAEDLFRHPLLLAECTRTERKSCQLTQELIFVNMSVVSPSLPTLSRLLHGRKQSECTCLQYRSGCQR